MMGVLKRKSITLKFVPLVRTWEVLSISNSVELSPGTLINGDYAKVLCDRDDWDVTITKLEIHLPMPLPPLPLGSVLATEAGHAEQTVLGPP